MKYLFICIVVLVLYNKLIAEDPNIKLSDNADLDLSEGCIHPDNKSVIDVGQKFYIKGSCKEYTCNGKRSYYGLSCDEFVPSDGCTKTSVNSTKDFPLCCPVEICYDATL